MSREERRTDASHTRLQDRLAHLDAIAELSHEPGRLPAQLGTDLGAVVTAARSRLGHGSTHTVVALAGATGSGKSSVFNSLVRDDVADVGVRRPTTSTAQAAVVGPDAAVGPGAAALLDWLEVDRRHVVDPAGSEDLSGLVLLDLPDHDSTEDAHRAEVERLLAVVDSFVWIVDPQKYADAAIHEGFLQRYAGHAAVSVVVLNQIDLVPETERRAVLDDLRRLLAADGLHDVRVLATSTRTGAGIAELRRELAARVAERRAVVARLHADVDRLADELGAHAGDHQPTTVDDRSRRALGRAFADAAGAEVVAEAVGAAHRRRAAQAVGWPPTRWVGRFRADPLRRLGLDRAERRDDDAPVGRTSRPATSAVSEAAATTATRHLVEGTTRDLPEPWRRRVADVALSSRDDVPDALDRAIGTTRLPTVRPRWWTAVAGFQWLLAGVMAVGLVWLVAIGVVAWLRLPDLPTPELGALPWPTVLAVGGALAGLLVSVVARAVAAASARRRTAAARRALARAASDAADALVIAPVDDELRALADLRGHVLALRP